VQGANGVDGHTAFLLLHAAEAGFDLRDPEFAAPAQHAVGFVDEVKPICAHEGKAEDSDVDAAGGEGEGGDVGYCHQRR
jgi:hypothetical protein